MTIAATMGKPALGITADRWLVGSMLGLCALGLLMVASSSMEYSERIYGSPFNILIRHALYLVIGLVGAFIVARMPVMVWQKWGWALLLLGLLLLVAVLVPGVGREVNGSWRWIRFAGVGIQPSEIMKLFLVLYIAGYLVRRSEEVRTQWSGFLKPILVMAIIIVLLLLEPDFGAVVVMISAVLGMMFLGGVRALQFFLLILVSSGAVALMAFAQPYRVERLMAFLDPWSSENVFASGYQLTQALIAFGRGEWFGVGLGNSMLKLFYLPEAHTDFVFAILGEEFGLIGVIAVLLLFAVLIGRIFLIGRKAELKNWFFAAYTCYGFALMLAVQTLINMGVSTGLLPTKGLTLPFLSYGGSSLVISLLMFGLVYAIASQLESYQPEEIS